MRAASGVAVAAAALVAAGAPGAARAAGAAAAGQAGTVQRAAPSALQGTIVQDSYASTAVKGPLRFSVYLPPGYASAGSRRYPVVYFLHGLPADEGAAGGIAWIGKALEQDGIAAIAIGAQGARQGDPDPEYLDWGPGRNWETAIAAELPRVVDGRYRTIASRAGRALIGVSAGGYGAAVVGLHHLDEFGAIESWSGYFHPTDPSGTKPLPRGSDLEDGEASAHTFVPTLRLAFAAHPTFLGFYVGAADPTFRQENVELARELSRAKVPFAFSIYPGGHTQALWQAQAPRWLQLALTHLGVTA